MPVFDAEKVMSADSYGLDAATRRATEDSNSRIDLMWWKRWFANLEANESEWKSRPALSSLFGSWKGERCIVAGAGPSLKENLPLLEEAAKCGWRIVSVDRAFTMLKEGGIRPDITVSSDAGACVTDFFDKATPGSDDVFALSVITHPDVYKKLSNCQIYVYSCANPFSAFWRFAAERLSKGVPCLRPGFIVTFSAVDLALWMGANPIMTVGNELSWREGAPTEKCYEDAKLIRAPGGRITISSFLKAARAFRFFSARYPDVEFIDASGGIAEGWKKTDMEKAIREISVVGVERCTADAEAEQPRMQAAAL